MRRVVPILFAFAILPASLAAADASACTVVRDAAGDVAVNDGSAVSGVPDPHVDVVGADVTATRGGLRFTIRATGLSAQRKGEWRLTFGSGRVRRYVAAGTGMWVNAGDYRGTNGFIAGTDGARPHPVRGTVDYRASEIRIEVPNRILGLTAGTTLSGWSLLATETFVNASTGEQVRLSDTASGDRTYVVGRAC